ncbi:MAG TPA: ATP-binding protein [Trueperaceae bacterium]
MHFPCPCGYHGDPIHPCICSSAQLRRYLDRISGPILDRIDIRITVPRISAEDLLRSPVGESSETVRARVEAAREEALRRQGRANSKLAGRELRDFCRLDARSERFMRQLVNSLSISGRGFDRLLRIARTIADLEGNNTICEEHLAEAASYRSEQRGVHRTA